jgi:hypothetical protein
MGIGHRSALLALLTFVATVGRAGAAPATPADVAGHWVSVGCETTAGRDGPQYVERDLRLTESTWRVDLSVYTGEGCSERSLEVRVEGPFLLGLESEAVPGATEALFVEAEVRITPRSEEAVALLSATPAGTCGAERWELDEPQSVRATGCEPLGVRPPSAEYDLVKREGDRLFLGARPPAGSDLNAPERRPTALNDPLALSDTP